MTTAVSLRSKKHNTFTKSIKIEEAICPICRDIYIEPVSLPCKHTVCLQCLERTIENVNLVCPICRQRIGTYIRLSKNLKKIIDQALWTKLQKQFPVEIERRLNGDEDGFSSVIFGNPIAHSTIAEQGSIKEEFDEMFHKLKIEEERSRQAEIKASEQLAKKLLEEERELARKRKNNAKELVKLDAQCIKTLIMSKSGPSGSFQRTYEDNSESNISCESNDNDSISDEMRHFTPICIAPRTPPKRLPNGTLKDLTIVRPISDLSTSYSSGGSSRRFRTLKNKMPLKVLSNNFQRTKKKAEPDDMETEESDNTSNNENSACKPVDISSISITSDIPSDIIKEQQMIEERIRQEKEDLALAIKLQAKLNKEKSVVKRQHGYELRSSKRNKKPQ